jgi:ribosome-binding factor A
MPVDEADEAQRETQAGLMSAAGFLRHHLAKALTTRHIPTLLFKPDKGLDNSIRVHELLKKIEQDRPQSGSGTEDETLVAEGSSGE